MKVNLRTILIDKKEIQYTHIENGSPVVCFMFSGAGYTYEKPLFYYSTMTMLQNQYDVVHIHYSYEQNILKLPLEDITKIMANDVNPIITEVLKNHQYQETMFLGKSLGTIPIINGLMKSDMYMNSKMVLLTPLLKLDSIFESLLNSNHSALIVIGEKDTHYIPSRNEEIQNKTNIKIQKVPYANHALDIEPFNTVMSITALEVVMKRLNQYLIE
ncbi:alpha/beta hydrolase [Peribacillus frigoritolerans]|uniref:alpha/beta hydrolase n=1 Tax=Peribacillus frigoritolerans TaxID=450367 RepID=UPI002E2045C8|nr:alpha/beta hydrolase [Peribacillus frigoritolerans]